MLTVFWCHHDIRNFLKKVSLTTGQNVYKYGYLCILKTYHTFKNCTLFLRGKEIEERAIWKLQKKYGWQKKARRRGNRKSEKK